LRIDALSTRGSAMARHKKATTSSAVGASAVVSTLVCASPSAEAYDRNAPSVTQTSSSK
jgi:hypothetical protein